MQARSVFLLCLTSAVFLAGCSSDRSTGPPSEHADSLGPEGAGGSPSEPGAVEPVPEPERPLWLTADVPSVLAMQDCRSVEIDYPTPTALVTAPEGLEYAYVDPAGLVVMSRGLSIECDQVEGSDHGGYLSLAFFVLVPPADSPLPAAEHRHLYAASTDLAHVQAFLAARRVDVYLVEGAVRSTGSPAGPAAQMEIESTYESSTALIHSAGVPEPAGAPARQVVWVTTADPVWQTPPFPVTGSGTGELTYLVADQTAAGASATGFAVEYSETDLHPFVMPRRPSANTVGFDLAIAPPAKTAP